MRSASGAVAFAAVLVLASSCARAPEEAPARSAAEPRIQLSLDPSGSGTVDVEGLPPEDLAQLQRAALTRDEWTALLRVQVATDDTPAPERPAVLGAYSVADGVLRFMPQFPFEPGTALRRRLRSFPAVVGRRRPGSGVASTPDQDDGRSSRRVKRHPATRVLEVYPTARSPRESTAALHRVLGADESAERCARMFDCSMTDGKAVVDPFLPLEVDLWNEDRTRYTLLFDPGRVKRGILPERTDGAIARRRPDLHARRRRGLA